MDGDSERRITIAAEAPDTSSPSSYEVRIRPGLLDEIGAAIADICPTHRYAVVTDTRVAELYGQRLMDSLTSAGLSATLFPFPAGEWNKTRGIWSDVTDWLIRSGFGRDSVVIAAGGGVVGDVAGFVAATYMRGLPVIQIPTTLLAMLDSSVGGKTGVDTPEGKNLVGAFHQPSLVLIDPTVLTTLPDHQLSSGLAEAYKHGLILDADYFGQLVADRAAIVARDPSVLERMIARSVEIKGSVVARDVRETGYRRVLNFGHTVAHALEAVTGYEQLHGEAVAIGLLAEARIGETIGLTEPGVAERVREALEAVNLPVELDADIGEDRFFETLERDKKRMGGEIRYTLIAEIGRVAGSDDGGWTHAVPPEVVKRVLFGSV